MWRQLVLEEGVRTVSEHHLTIRTLLAVSEGVDKRETGQLTFCSALII